MMDCLVSSLGHLAIHFLNRGFFLWNSGTFCPFLDVQRHTARTYSPDPTLAKNLVDDALPLPWRDDEFRPVHTQQQPFILWLAEPDVFVKAAVERGEIMLVKPFRTLKQALLHPPHVSMLCHKPGMKLSSSPAKCILAVSLVR